MFPILNLFGREVPTYSIAAGAGILLAVLYLRRRKAPSICEADKELAFLYALAGALVGAKLFWLLSCWEEFCAELPFLFSHTELFLQKYLYSGLMFYGGLYGSAAFLLLYCKSCALDEAAMLNLLLPAFPLIHAFGRVGCFCVGCCYGKHSEHTWLTVTFHTSSIAPNEIPLLPVQLWEAAAELLLFAVTARMARRGVDGRRMLSFYLIAYGGIRFLLEFCRGDSYRGFLGVLSLSQWISISSILVGFCFLLYGKSKIQSPPTTNA